MALKMLSELVERAEAEGVTLAEMISRAMSEEEMFLAQEALAQEMSANYAAIEDFMASVSVPSLQELLAELGSEPGDDIEGPELLLSDTPAAETR